MKLTILPLLAAAFCLTLPSISLADDQKTPPKGKTEKKDRPRKSAKGPETSRVPLRGLAPPEKSAPQRPGPQEPAQPKFAPRNSDKEGPQRTFLGVATSSVSPDLREHLELEEGFGIQIQDAVENSPAEKAGLRKHDILVKFEDQRLINPEHLSLLVRGKKSGDEVELTLIRKGEEQVKKLTLGETDESFFTPRFDSQKHPSSGPHPPTLDRTNPQRWQDYMQKQQDYFRNRIESPRPRPPVQGSPVPNDQNKKSDAAKPLPKAVGRPPAISVRPGFPVTVLGSKGVIKIDNQEGDVTITETDGKHQIEIRDAKGNLIHEGKYDPKAGTEALPEKAQEHLKKMKLDNLEILPPRADEKVEKISDPRKEKKEASKEKIL